MIKRVVAFLVAGILAIFAQGMLLQFGLSPKFVPQFVVLLVVYLAFYEVSITGALLAFSLGLMLDLSSALLIGPWAGAMVAVYGVLVTVSQRLFIDSMLVGILTAFVAVIGGDVVYLSLASEYRSPSWSYPMMLVGQAGATAIFAPLVFALLSRRMKKRATSLVTRDSVAGLA